MYLLLQTNAPINVKLLGGGGGGGGGGKAGHRRGICTQISFSVQIPSPREVILGQKSANSSHQGHYCWSKEVKVEFGLFRMILTLPKV